MSHPQAFAMIPVRVVTDTALSHAEFRAFAAVVVHRNTRTGWSFPTHATLAANLGLAPGISGEERIRQLLKPSIDCGYLERISGSGRTRSRYRVIYDMPAPTDEDLAKEGAVDEGTLEDDWSPPLESSGKPPLAAKGRTIREYKTREPDDSESLILADEPAKARSREAEFEAFWNAYPRKTGKLAAKAKFDTARKKAGFDDIMAGLVNYRPDPEFTAHPATWLHQGRWMDEPSTSLPFSLPGQKEGIAPHDPADPWGINATVAALPDATDDRNAVTQAPIKALGGWDVVASLTDICQAAGLSRDWRGDLGPVCDWLREGLDPDLIAAAIRGARKPDKPGSWRFWDARVREWVQRGRA